MAGSPEALKRSREDTFSRSSSRVLQRINFKKFRIHIPSSHTIIAHVVSIAVASVTVADDSGYFLPSRVFQSMVMHAHAG